MILLFVRECAYISSHLSFVSLRARFPTETLWKTMKMVSYGTRREHLWATVFMQEIKLSSTTQAAITHTCSPGSLGSPCKVQWNDLHDSFSQRRTDIPLLQTSNNNNNTSWSYCWCYLHRYPWQPRWSWLTRWAWRSIGPRYTRGSLWTL